MTTSWKRPVFWLWWVFCALWHGAGTEVVVWFSPLFGNRLEATKWVLLATYMVLLLLVNFWCRLITHTWKSSNSSQELCLAGSILTFLPWKIHQLMPLLTSLCFWAVSASQCFSQQVIWSFLLWCNGVWWL